LSGVICVDVDILDKDIQDKIYNQLPPLYCGKKGNKKKGINYFFKYNGEESRAFKGIDILSNGKQTVLPPSQHDNGYPYAWVGVPLVGADLPDLPAGFIDWCEANFGTSGKKITYEKENGRCVHGSHNKLSEIMVACIHDGETIQEIVDKLIEFDNEINKDISYFTCKTGRWKRKNKELNIHDFVVKAMDRHISIGVIKEIPKETPIIEILPEIEKPKRQKFPHLRGIAGEMFDYIYLNSPVPRSRLALSSVLSTVSIILGNKVRWGSVYPNLYCLMVAPSGAGKDFPLNFPRDLLYRADLKNLIGESHPASDSGLIMNLPDQPTRIDMIDEADILFSAINSKSSSFLSKMADVYATLYTSPGKHYGGKHILGQKSKDNEKGNLGECYSPYITMLGAMTPKAFRESFSTKTMEKGLGARFLYFIDETRKRTSLKINPDNMPDSFLKFANMWRSFEKYSVDLSDHLATDLKATKKAEQAMVDFNNYVEELKFKTDMDDKMMPLLNRMAIFAVKIAQIDAASINPSSTSITINKESVDFATRFTETLFKDNKAYIEMNVAENQIEYSQNIVRRVVFNSPNGVTKSELLQKTRSIPRQIREGLIKDLIEAGDVVIVKIATKGKPTTKLMANREERKV